LGAFACCVSILPSSHSVAPLFKSCREVALRSGARQIENNPSKKLGLFSMVRRAGFGHSRGYLLRPTDS